MKKKAKYRIIKTTSKITAKDYYIIEYRKFLFWHTYYWFVKARDPEPDLYSCECDTEEMAREKLKECKAVNTREVIYEE